MEMKHFKTTKYVAPKTKKSLKDLFWVLIFPIIGLSFLFAGIGVDGKPVFTDQVVLNGILLTMITVLIACFALNTNLNSGRMDFSLGSVGILACVIAWNILPNHGDANFPVIFLITSIVLGILLGLLSGTLFVLLKIPAIVVSLGVCLIFEGAAYVITHGKGSVDLPAIEAPALYPFISSPVFMIFVVLVISVFMLLTLKYSKFGHDKLSLLFGQKVSVDTGVNEIKNALVCYGLAGALIAIYTFISSIKTTQIAVSTNLGSAMSVMANFLPIFLGGLIAKHSNEVVGLILGVVSVTFFKTGLTKLGMSDSNISLITSFLIFIILTYMVNWVNWVNAIKNKIKNYKLSKYEGK